MGEAEMDAFQKALAALGFSAQGVGLVNIARIRSTDGAALSGDRLTQILLSRFKPVKIILLGVEPDRLGFEEQQLPFHMATDLQAVTWLYTYSFPDMLDHVDKKRTYWSSIKAFLV